MRLTWCSHRIPMYLGGKYVEVCSLAGDTCSLKTLGSLFLRLMLIGTDFYIYPSSSHHGMVAHRETYSKYSTLCMRSGMQCSGENRMGSETPRIYTVYIQSLPIRTRISLQLRFAPH